MSTRPGGRRRTYALVSTAVLSSVAAVVVLAGAAVGHTDSIDGAAASPLTGVLASSGGRPATTAPEVQALAPPATGRDLTVQTVTTSFTDVERDRVLAVTAYVPAGGSYPLVVLAHGYAAAAADYAELATGVARQGFVVVAPDFPRSSSAVTSSPERDYVEQAVDVSFLITAVTGSESPAALRQAIAATRKVAVIGHSDGGITAAGVAFNSGYADPRVAAAVVLSGAAIGFPSAWSTDATPALLAIHGDADDVNPFASSTSLFALADGPKWLVEVIDGDHTGPFTTGEQVGAVATLVADFLRSQLVGDAAARARIAADASVPGQLALVDTA
jgi:dienelactone hydrolase